jgi:beta-phosphoglucomutase-like phosphatase (HAD superfamily)
VSHHEPNTVATSATPEELKPLLEAARVSDLVDQRTTSGDAKNSKPDPDIVQAAIGRSGHRADQLINVGRFSLRC